ncbi:hypothetical protein ACFYUY_04530 [Kitasatospora sp. NPDC004745]|uniref:hypothetical protein n=1 Tax=Kitasatospora sp. NPDC004745 TaxID=3364019 RepID=UPI0036B11C0F
MTTFIFRNDADLDTAEYARYCGLIEAAAPLVAELSGLALPECITARPVTPAQFIQRQTEDRVCVTGMALDSVPALPEEAATALLEQVRTNTETMVTRFHPTNRAAILWRGPGQPELTFMPEVHARHLRPSDRQLTTVFAHEITHLAQFALRPELATAPLRCKLLDTGAGLPPEQHRNAAALTEGHGQYVERLVSQKLCGEAAIGALHGEPEPSDLYKELKADPAAPTNNPAYSRGEQFVAAVVEAGGHPLLRLLLAQEELVPTEAEIVDPAPWIARLQRAVESDTPAPFAVVDGHLP